MKENYQKVLDHTIEEITASGCVPTLLIHSCCAPCSSYVLEYLSQFFRITVLYYNPNIYPEEEYYKRVKEQEHFIQKFPAKHPITFLEGSYDKELFYQKVAGLEQEPEGGKRCTVCFMMRLEEAGEAARRLHMDYFTTTLSISPLKDAQRLNEIGQSVAQKVGVSYLVSDFKKKNGYQRSVELSREYGMYRQDYCGCVFSKREREQSMNTSK